MSVGLQRLRDDADTIRNGAIAKREDPKLVDRAIELDAHRRELLSEHDDKRHQLKTNSERIGHVMRANPDAGAAELADLRELLAGLGERIAAIGNELQQTESEIDDLLLRIPNPPDPDVPVGGEEASVIVRTWGEPASAEGR